MKRTWNLILLLSVLLSVPHGGAVAQGTPEPGTPQAVQDLFDIMTPEERVGQLFLATFIGTEVSGTSSVYDLIVNRHVGGVVLLAGNDNFAAAPDTLTQARELIRQLQQAEWNSSVRPPSDPLTGGPVSRAYVPLLIGTIQDGDGAPGDQLLSSGGQLPSALALGATWSPVLAEKAGAVTGAEVSSIGFNMLFGPSLDVLENPGTISANDPGTGVFGSDPFWVSEMGRAYVTGLHRGARSRLLVIPKYFPGRGSSDRLVEQEVATVRKSLEELKQVELAPFFAVTSGADDPGGIADGLLLSHIRYQGFQGNIRATTKPVSFDAQALGSIMSLPEFAAWRDAGGLLVSDNLGSNAVRHFYVSGTEFQARNVARDAFVAGNDLLYLGNIVSSDAPDAYATAVDIIGFFVRKYREDPGFAQLVDAAVLRVLTVKYHMYSRFDLATVLTQPAPDDEIPSASEIALDVASRSATLLSPSAQDLSSIIQAPPRPRDRIIFFTDATAIRQCSTCPETPGLAVEALQRAVVTLYGPESSNQTSAFRLSSYSLSDAEKYAAGKSPPYLAEDLLGAGWVVFSLVDNTHGQARIVSNFLAEQQDVLRDKRVVLFAFGSPTYLDSTDISRLTAYYALYSKQPAFVEVAARLLYQEITPVGASPVSIPGLSYDLRSVTAPNPDQVITLTLDLPPVVAATGEPAPPSTPVPLFRMGDTINIRTGAIKDHNGHVVPDGTVVTFALELVGEGGGILKQEEAITTQGVARVAFALEKPGLLEIHASSDPARVSQVLQLDVSSLGALAAVTVIVPQLTPVVVAESNVTPAVEANDYVTASGGLRFSAWVATILLLLAGTISVGFAGARIAGQQWGLRWGLGALAGGLIPYNYIALGLPGGESFAAQAGIGGIILLSVAGLLVGWAAGWVWWRQTDGVRNTSGG